jgi:hypothetical protein
VNSTTPPFDRPRHCSSARIEEVASRAYIIKYVRSNCDSLPIYLLSLRATMSVEDDIVTQTRYWLTSRLLVLFGMFFFGSLLCLGATARTSQVSVVE